MIDQETYASTIGDSKTLKYVCDVPYCTTRTQLYGANELFDAFDANDPQSASRCHDAVVYAHMMKSGKLNPNPTELWARTMHDYHIRLAMQRFLAKHEQSKVVGIMGGHQLKRTDPMYAMVVDVAKQLTEQGYLMISGGGPGAMEATHLGAWLAGRNGSDVETALRTLAAAPGYADDGWLKASMEVLKMLPQKSGYESLAIPTWFYGHEPPTAFATHIAKLFENSLREDTILTEAYGGLIFMPGSAGTLQEVFQEAVQDHYVSLGYPSPMIFVGRDFWTCKTPVYSFLEDMMRCGQYKNLMLTLADTTAEVLRAVVDGKKIYEQYLKANQ